MIIHVNISIGYQKGIIKENYNLPQFNQTKSSDGDTSVRETQVLCNKQYFFQSAYRRHEGSSTR